MRLPNALGRAVAADTDPAAGRPAVVVTAAPSSSGRPGVDAARWRANVDAPPAAVLLGFTPGALRRVSEPLPLSERRARAVPESALEAQPTLCPRARNSAALLADTAAERAPLPRAAGGCIPSALDAAGHCGRGSLSAAPCRGPSLPAVPCCAGRIAERLPNSGVGPVRRTGALLAACAASPSKTVSP